jgi:hypothetical protein
MVRNGYKIFDADTHVRPDADLLEPYLTAAARAKLVQYEKYKAKNKDGAVTYLMGERSYKRRLGLAHDAAPQTNEYMSGYKRHQHGKPNPLCERDPAMRIQDMDVEGIDVNLMLPSGWFGCWTTIDDVALETAVYEAYHRWMAHYCAAFPSRLKGVILVAARDVKAYVVQRQHPRKPFADVFEGDECGVAGHENGVPERRAVAGRRAAWASRLASAVADGAPRVSRPFLQFWEGFSRSGNEVVMRPIVSLRSLPARP